MVLVYAYIPEFNLPFGVPFLTGLYSDFDPLWYKSVGTIILLNMIANLVFP